MAKACNSRRMQAAHPDAKPTFSSRLMKAGFRACRSRSAQPHAPTKQTRPCERPEPPLALRIEQVAIVVFVDREIAALDKTQRATLPARLLRGAHREAVIAAAMAGSLPVALPSAMETF
jgi:hypothetical protein